MSEAPSAVPSEVVSFETSSFETSLDELEKIVKVLEGGDLPLEKSLELFEKGMNLSDACRKQLEQAETRVEMLIRKDGKWQPQALQQEKP